MPVLLGSVPSTIAGPMLAQRGAAAGQAVTAIEFVWEQGLLLTGHEGGEVRMDGQAARGVSAWMC